MSISISTAGKSVDTNAVDAYDSGDDWEIGVGNLIIDLDADLEKDRQKFEMSNSTSSSCTSKDSGHGLASSGAVNSTSSSLADSLKFASVQQQSSGPQGNSHKDTSKSKVKRSKTSRDVNKSLASASFYGIPEIGVGAAKRQQEAGRLGEVASTVGMSATLGHNSGGAGLNGNTSCNKTLKDEKTGGGKSQSTRGSKRDKDSGKSRKDNNNKLYDLAHANTGVNSQAVVHLYGFGSGKASGNGSPFHCGNSLAGEMAKSTVDSGIMGNTALVKKEDDDDDEEESHRRNKKLKTEKVDPLFTVPAPPPPPVHSSISPQIQPSYFSSSSTTIAAPVEQLLVRTRSVGVNTCDAGVVTEPECLGPCEPGTSVNLEGIVWHETEEGVLVVNVTWRNKTYVGTLLDCTKHDWAPPRFCDSPTSDFEMRGGRGRGKRARSAANTTAAAAPGSDANFTETRGLQNKNRGGANGKGRRGYINASGRRTPPNCAIEDVKASPSPAGKRKNKPQMELDLNSSSEDNKPGKRVRTNSRSTPTTPQGKGETTFLDQGCSSPVLIDCPHPNCNKKYKHINGLRYHQAHAHLDPENKLEFEQDSEDKVSDCEEALSNVALECNESSTSLDQLKAPMSPGLQGTPGTPKGKRDVASNSPNQINSSKSGKHSGKKKGLNVELNNLPVISNMAATLENGSVIDSSLTVEMPKLEAEGLIDKKNLTEKEKVKKATNCKVDKNISKLKTARPIAPAPAPTPPQLIAIPGTAFTNTTTGTIPGLPSLATTVVQATPKSPPLKPIQPKPTIMGEPNTVNPSLTSLKDKKKKEKRKQREKESKEAVSPKADSKVSKGEDMKAVGKDLSSQFIKEHVNKNEVLVNGISDAQESRMASIKAEADKVYTFTDNSPSPSIGSASRVECSTVINGQSSISPLHVLTQNGGDSSAAKTNSPAYSDISDAADDGGSDSRSEGQRSKTSSPSEIICNKDNIVKGHSTSMAQSSQAKEPHSPYYHGYDPYYSPSYVHSGQVANNLSVNNSPSQVLKLKKDSEDELEKKDKIDILDCKKNEVISNNIPSQHQSVITQRHPALAQSLYYGQYAYGLYMDQKSLIASNPAYRQQYEKYYEDQRMAEQKISQTNRECERKSDNVSKECGKDDNKLKTAPSATISKPPSTPEPSKSISKMGNGNRTDEPMKSQVLPNHQQLQCDSFKAKQMENHQLIKEAVEMKSVMDSMKQTGVDPTMRFKQDSDSRSWHNYVYQSKFLEQHKADELEREKKIKEENVCRTPNKDSTMTTALQNMKEEKEVKRPDSQSVDEKNKNDDRKTPVNWKDSRNARVAVSSPMSQHQSYIQYLHAYPYTQMYDPNHPAYRAVSPVLMHGYPGAYLSPGFPHYSVYGKVSGRDEAEKSSTSPSINSKSASESKALDLLQQHANQYRTKSPALAEKPSSERDRETERERDRHSPFGQRHLHTHHHTHVGVGYPLIPGQYDPFQGNEYIENVH